MKSNSPLPRLGQTSRFPLVSYRPALDGMRGVAVLGVLLIHSQQVKRYFPGGGLGVDLFFVLSGYLITTILKEEFDSCGKIVYARFYGRRILRLYPALAVCVLLAGILAGFGLVDVTFHDYRKAAGAALFYLSNIVSFDMKPLVHTWSLSMEEQFYLTWPLLLSVVVLRFRPKGRVFAIIVLLALIITIRNVLLEFPSLAWRDHNILWHIYTWPITRGDGLMFGALAAFALDLPGRGRDLLGPGLGLAAIPAAGLILFVFLSSVDRYLWLKIGTDVIDAALAIVLVLAVIEPKNPRSPVMWWIKLLAVPLVGCLAVAWALLWTIPFSVAVSLCLLTVAGGGTVMFLNQKRPDGVIVMTFKSRLLRWIGKRSYGIYLYHLPIFIALDNSKFFDRQPTMIRSGVIFSLQIVITFAMAALSYRFVEAPLLAKKDLWIGKGPIKPSSGRGPAGGFGGRVGVMGGILLRQSALEDRRIAGIAGEQIAESEENAEA